MARTRDKATDEISKRLGVTKGQARRVRNRLLEENQILEDEALIALLSPIEKEKLRKLTVERELKQEQLAILRRQHVSVGEVHTLGIRLGSSVSELASSSIANWPAELSGRTEIQIREILTRFWDSFVEQFRAAAKKI
jgi:hypothetical protein